MPARQITPTATPAGPTAPGTPTAGPEASFNDAPLRTREAAGPLPGHLLPSPGDPKEPRGR